MLLARCLTHNFEVRRYPHTCCFDSLELSVDAKAHAAASAMVSPPPARFKNIRYNVRIESPESEETIDELRQAVEATCPLYNLIKDEQKLEGKIVHAGRTKRGREMVVSVTRTLLALGALLAKRSVARRGRRRRSQTIKHR